MTTNLEQLIKNAKIEFEFDEIIATAHLETATCEEILNYFLAHHKELLSVYKLSNGWGLYDLIVLYKNVARICVFDCMQLLATELEQKLPITKDWEVYQAFALKIEILKQLFKNPWDERRVFKFKPTAEKTWEIIEQLL